MTVETEAIGPAPIRACPPNRAQSRSRIERARRKQRPEQHISASHRRTRPLPAPHPVHNDLITSRAQRAPPHRHGPREPRERDPPSQYRLREAPPLVGRSERLLGDLRHADSASVADIALDVPFYTAPTRGWADVFYAPSSAKEHRCHTGSATRSSSRPAKPSSRSHSRSPRVEHETCLSPDLNAGRPRERRTRRSSSASATGPLRKLPLCPDVNTGAPHARSRDRYGTARA